MRLSDPITAIKGIGEKTAVLFYEAGIHTVSELLHTFPRTYRRIPKACRISEIRESGSVIVEGRISGGLQQYRSGGKDVISFKLMDGSGCIAVSYFNMPYLRKSLHAGKSLLLYGTVTLSGGVLKMAQPLNLSAAEYEKLAGSLQPVYVSHGELKSSRIAAAVEKILPLTEELRDYLPQELLAESSLYPIGEAIRKLHAPITEEEAEKARKRIAFDEFFLFLLRMELLRTDTEKVPSSFICKEEVWKEVDAFTASLPYALTGAQQRTLSEIKKDTESGSCMNRLVQGDVGSGKTIVAYAVAYAVILSGYQAVLMAPTEVLATQHYEGILRLVKEHGLKLTATLLTGSVKKKEKLKIKEEIESGKIDLVIGTHAVLQEDVHFHALGLAITDEQHRFGVKQRSILMEQKGQMPHILVMSATPIPRTLGIILYGDLDISLIDELPAKRLPIKNTVRDASWRQKLWQFIYKRICEGRQAYVICPMVEAPEEGGSDLANVEDYSKLLAQYMPAPVKVAALHGRMKPEEKTQVMDRFAAGEIHILVSTTVIEVGVNVPNAVVMLVENAERFGLSQLHQLRGRVGRGEHQSYCAFLAGSEGKKPSERAMERLKILEQTTDGFAIAEEDLKSRGAGDFFGVRQSGQMMFQMADIYADSEELILAKRALEKLGEEGNERLFEVREALTRNQEMNTAAFHCICL